MFTRLREINPLSLLFVLIVVGHCSPSWANQPTAGHSGQFTRPPLSAALYKGIGVFQSHFHALRNSPAVFDSRLTSRLANLHHLGLPVGQWLQGAEGETAAINLATGDIWRGQDGAEVAFIGNQRAFMEELISNLEGRGGNELTARWWSSFIMTSTVAVGSHRDTDFSNAQYHHVPSMYGGSWFAQTYFGGESNLLHSNWGKLRKFPISWDIENLVAAPFGANDAYWQTESRQHNRLPWKANLDFFANFGFGFDMAEDMAEVQGINPTLLGGFIAKAALGENDPWNFHLSVYRKVAGGIDYSFAPDGSVGEIGRTPLRHWTNATVGSAWIPASWVRLAALYGTAIGSGPQTLGREKTADANISFGDAKRVRVEMGANYVLHSAHPMRHHKLALHFNVNLQWANYLNGI